MPLKWDKRTIYNKFLQAKIIQLTAEKPNGELVNKVIMHCYDGAVIEFRHNEIKVLSRCHGKEKFLKKAMLIKKVFPGGEWIEREEVPEHLRKDVWKRSAVKQQYSLDGFET